MTMRPAGEGRIASAPARVVSQKPPSMAGLAEAGAIRLLTKRCLDVIASLILLIFASPWLLFLAVWIKFLDGGPVIHRRRVVGLQGEFDAYKLRTMRADADRVLAQDHRLRKEYEQNFKLKNDPRVTPAGRVIRRLSLDELPQLLNVLKGEMSLVGPRMITPPELERYGASQWIFRAVKPGVTGYWQVHRSGMDYSERIEMDLFYVQNRTLFLDLKIIMRTPLKIVKGD